MSNAKLNTDVLVVVSNFLKDYSDVLSLSLVSSIIRPIATRRLLSMRPISLTGAVSIQKFHAFLLADPVARAPHIRALRIGASKLPLQIANETENVSSLLVDIITSCTRLEHVAMCFAQCSTDSDDVVAAVAALKTLRSLEVSGWSENAFDLLHDVSSPLRKLAIHSGSIRSPDALDKFLPRLAPSLEELELLHFRIQRGRLVALNDAPGPDVDPYSFRRLKQYPAVRSLSVIMLIGPPLLDRLQHLFPALDGTLSLGEFDTQIHVCSHDDIRAANRRTQDDAPERAWRKFDRVVCDAPMLYVLALRCPVRLVMIDKGSAETLHYAADALRENPVPRLKLTLQYGQGMFGRVFTPELAGMLSHLTLCLMYDNKNTWRSDEDARSIAQLLWEDLLGTTLSALRPLHNLTHIRVFIHSQFYRHGDAVHGLQAYSQKFADGVRGPAFDFDGTATSLVRVLPSLRYVFLTTSGFIDGDQATEDWRSCERWNVSRGWRVANEQPGMPGLYRGKVHDEGEDPARRLVELHSDVADTIVEREELVLSETDECCLFPEELGSDADE